MQVTQEGTTPDRSSVTAEEKARIIAGVSQVMLDVLNKPLASTYVVIEEVDLDNGVGAVFRRRSIESCSRNPRTSAAVP